MLWQNGGPQLSDKKRPLRMCVSCREMKEKTYLIKVVKSAGGEIVIDKTGKLPGRGAYVCKNPDCVLKSEKKHSFERTFKGQVPPLLYHSLRNEIDEQN
jgi:predicted RNA-binding protein YlxR (DUF448 family)